MEQELHKKLSDQMHKALKILDKDLMGLRTGRASVNLLDSVMIEQYGNHVPLSQVGAVSTPDPRTIAIQVWDKFLVKDVEKAIVEANLGFNPTSDGQLVRINIPPLSEERRKEIVKFAYKYGENAKIVLRNIRRDGMDTIKKQQKNNEISKDVGHDYSQEVQKLTDDFIAKIDQAIKIREKEILTV